MGSVKRFKRVYVEITNVCNLACTFCQETKREKRFMTVEEFTHVIDEIKPYSKYIYLHVKGEPLLHPQLEKILEICEHNDITVNITTNGTLVKEKLDILTSHKIHQINISVHSADDNSNIDVEDYIEDLFYCCDEINTHTQTEISLRLWNTKESPELFGKSNCRIREHLHVNVQSPFEWPDINNEYRCKEGFCQGLRTHIGILCDGTVVPCCLDGNGVIALGNIFSSHMSDILITKRTNDIIKGFRDRKVSEELCVHCSFKERF